MLRSVTATVWRNGHTWNAEASLPEPDCFSAEAMVIGGDDGGIEIPHEYVACVITLLDMSVDKGVEAS